jgi:hypothetical protein
MPLTLSGDIAGLGKIVQIVRATDTTSRGTTSTSYTDVTGMTVTITPQKTDSAVIIMAVCRVQATSTTDNLLWYCQITDSSNNAISGCEDVEGGTFNVTGTSTRTTLDSPSLIAYATPATTSATTYKLRFKSSVASTTTTIRNDLITGQMYAIEVAA